MKKILEVSVTIPVYNSERTLKQCLNSVLNQTYSNYEIILIDNNSTDNTKQIIKEFQEKNKKIKYVFEHHRTRGAARNAGVRAAKGEIIVMTDADCIVPKNWIKEISKPIIYKNEIVVIGPEKDIIKNYWTKNIQKRSLEFFEKNRDKNYIRHLDTKNFSIKSSIMKKLMFDSNLKTLEDFDLYLRLKRITKIRFLPTLKVEHHHSSSFKKFVKNNFERGYCAKKVYNKHKKNFDLKNEPITENISFGNFLLFPIWISFSLFKKPTDEFYFNLVAELSWRLGVMWEIIKIEKG